MNYFNKNFLKRLWVACIPSAGRTAWIRKHKYFKEFGKYVHFQPRILPSDPQYIKIHNNVAIASRVGFTNHDSIHFMFNGLSNRDECQSHLGCIEIMDNVFIGANTEIMPNVKIGSNAIVAANALVCKDVLEGEIWGTRLKRLNHFMN